MASTSRGRRSTGRAKSAVRGKLNGDSELQFARGAFFCITSDVWSVGRVKSKPQHGEAFRREGSVCVMVRDGRSASGIKTIDPYKLTREAMEKAGTKPAKAHTTRSESSGGKGKDDKDISKKYQLQRAIWPVDILGRKVDKGQEIAHLLPACPTVHEEWFGVAAAVMGLPKEATIRQQLMATRGVVVVEGDADAATANRQSSRHRGAGKRKMAEQASNDTSAPRKPAAKKKKHDATVPKRAASTCQPKQAPPRAQPPPSDPVGRKQAFGPERLSARISQNVSETRKTSGDEDAGALVASVAAPRRAPRAASLPPASRDREDGELEDSSRGRVSFGLSEFQATASQDAGKRMNKTGAVHFASNKLRLEGQKELIDGETPVLLIVPCMSLMKANNGEAKSTRQWSYRASQVDFPEFPRRTPHNMLTRTLRRSLRRPSKEQEWKRMNSKNYTKRAKPRTPNRIQNCWRKRAKLWLIQFWVLSSTSREWKKSKQRSLRLSIETTKLF